MTSLLRVLNTRTSDSLTLKIRIESGEKLYIAVRMVYLNRNYVIAFIRDITEDEVQRRENEKYRFFLESILENLPIATTVKDKNDEGRYLIWNKKAAEMMDCPPPQRHTLHPPWRRGRRLPVPAGPRAGAHQTYFCSAPAGERRG